MENIISKEHVFLFQGVGTEYQSLVNLFDEKQKSKLDHYCSIVNKAIGLDLWNYLYNSLPTKYDKTFSDWAAIYTVDYIVYETYTDLHIKPGMFIGHSMGLITALACGKAFDFETGLRIMLSSYEYAKLVPRENETMGVITGINSNSVERIIKENKLDEYVEIAIENNEFCIVISGINHGIDKVLALALDEGALKAKDLCSPYAFHSHYALRGVERYAEYVEKSNISDSMVPIISTYNQNIIQSSSDFKKELKKNTSSRMYWRTAIEKLISSGFNSFIEVSLSNSITKFTKMINTECNYITYKKLFNIKA